MKALILTNEFPPNTYGGAGVHVDYLTRELSRICEVEVRCFGNQEVTSGALTVQGREVDTSAWTAPAPLHSVLGAVQRCLDFNTRNVDADVIHLHTWYSHFGGILAKLNYGIPMVLTVHSLEPLRPWKREQLGGGYDFTVWLEKTAIEMADAVVAVSEGTRADVMKLFDVPGERVRIIRNGIDPGEFKKVENPGVLARFGIDPGWPYILFVGRVTRQKGIIHLVNAVQYMNPGFQIVLCAGAPDTPAIGREMEQAVVRAQSNREGIVWIHEMVDLATKVALYSHAELFCCPSIYEPFGIINLEAMACETAVVASAVGGIGEVVVDGETGLLVTLEQHDRSPFEPVDPVKFERDLAESINQLMEDEALRRAMGKAGRKRAEEKFHWEAIARETLALYEELTAR